MKVIVIDPMKKTVEEKILEDNSNILEELYKIINCRCVQSVLFDDGFSHDLVVDEEGLFNEEGPICFFKLNLCSKESPINAGIGVVVGNQHSEDGISWGGCTLSLEEVRGSVQFLTKEEVINEYKDYVDIEGEDDEGEQVT